MEDTPTRPRLRRGPTADVIVVGAGPAGAATAMMLARAGVRTLLVDRGSRDLHPPATGTLMRGGVLQLSRWGVLDDIVAAGTPAVTRTTYRYGDERIVISTKPSHGVDALYAPRRDRLASRLQEAAVDAGAVVHRYTAATDLIWRVGQVVGVHATTLDDHHVDLRAALVIGADGVRSTVAEQVGASFTRVGEHANAGTYAHWSDLPTNGYEWILRPNVCCGVIPTNDGEACVFASAPADRLGIGGASLVAEVVAQSAPDLADRLAAATPGSASGSWAGRRGYIRRAHGPGWALVGDAGYFTDPLCAHGPTDALRDAELLARAVVEGLGGVGIDGASLLDALGHYEATRDRLSHPLFGVVDRIASHQWDDDEIAGLLLQLNSAMADEVEALAALEPELRS